MRLGGGSQPGTVARFCSRNERCARWSDVFWPRGIARGEEAALVGRIKRVPFSTVVPMLTTTIFQPIGFR